MEVRFLVLVLDLDLVLDVFHRMTISVKMVGSRKTYGMLKFLLVILAWYSFRLGPDWQRLLQAGQALDGMVDVWHRHADSWTIPQEDRKDPP